MYMPGTYVTNVTRSWSPSYLVVIESLTFEMAVELVPIPLPTSADASKLANFGREVRGVNPADITSGSELFKEIETALYTVRLEFIENNFCAHV